MKTSLTIMVLALLILVLFMQSMQLKTIKKSIMENIKNAPSDYEQQNQVIACANCLDMQPKKPMIATGF
ncbi:hypothetical protein HYW20_04395 [Candidatus Woesearchaeota archaeon]|nr:hypothetical protein [Candidatus Woesearchaeota archaeon]